MEWASAIEVAKAIRLELQPACERIEIGGSLRRLRPDINDVEIIAQPRISPFNELDLRLLSLGAEKRLVPGPRSSDGKKPPYGPRYKRLAEPLSGLQVDVFSVLPPADFGVIYTIRTGSAAFSHWFVTEALRRSYKVDKGQLFRIHRDEQPWRFERIPCPEERDVFQALGIPWPPPHDREPGIYPAITIPGLAAGVAGQRSPDYPSASSAGSSRDRLQISTATYPGE
jgi:DNA polymerase/3'-5' exonuclease PolX